MRPSVYDIIGGIEYTLMEVMMPIVEASGEAEAVREGGSAGGLVRRLSASWDSEGETFFNENKEMREALQAALPAFRQAGLGEAAAAMEEHLNKEYYPAGGYPAVRALMQENDDLKVALEEALTAIYTAKTPPASLKEAHARFRKIIKRQLERDLGLQMVMLGFIAERAMAQAAMLAQQAKGAH